MNIYSSEAGPMTREEMIDWLAGGRMRHLDHLCLVAAGWNPDSEEGRNYDYKKEEGLAARIRSHTFTANRASNDGFWIEKPDDDGINKTSKDVFVEWLSQHPGWKDEAPCRRLIGAWEYYRLMSLHPESKISNKEEGALQVIEAVRSDYPEIKSDFLAAQRALGDSKYDKFLPSLTDKKGAKLKIATITANASKAKKKRKLKLDEKK